MSDETDSAGEVLLFGDLAASSFEDQLRHLLHCKTNPLLEDLFGQVGLALRKLIGTLPLQQQLLFPRFTTLLDLVYRIGETEGTPVLNFFSLSLFQIAAFINYYSQESRRYPSPESSRVVGICTGGFAAAAIGSSKTLPDLIPAAVQVVLAAFRTALHSYLAGHDWSQFQYPSLESWSTAISVQDDTDIQTLIEEYNKSKISNQFGKIYLSATTAGKKYTVNGQPSVLTDFLTKHSEHMKFSRLNIHSPFHAPHLFNSSDVEHIAEKICHDALSTRYQVIPIVSAVTGNTITGSNFLSLLRMAIHDTLREPLRVDLISASLRDTFLRSKIRRCFFLPFGGYSSIISTTLAKDMSVTGVIDVTAPTNQSCRTTGRFDTSKIAVVGYSGRFPSAASNDEFWELLYAGRDVHREIPPDRFNWETHFDPTGKKKNTSRVKYGCFIDEPGLFDARFFNMSPREAENTDPGQRLLITATYEAIEMAGLVPNRTPSTQQDRIGVYIGTTSDDWREVNSGQDIDTYFIPGGNRAFFPGRISYFFKFSGPSLSIDTACSSSFAAIQTACASLWSGACDTAVAGGTNVLTNPDNFAGLDRGHFLTTNGNCNTFDDGASGYCRSDGVGVVILKRLEDAVADKDPIFGVIVGTNTNHSGQTDSITRPHEGDQASVFRHIMRYSNVDPLDISYIEMHGTGTQAGDATEMGSVLSVFAPERKRTLSQPVRPLHLGAVKANVGHAESSSGVLSLIKVLLMMKHSEIPPHCGIKTRINHHYPLDLTERGVHIALKPTPWCRKDSASRKRSVFLNNFSAAGGNTAILLEDAPEREFSNYHAENTEILGNEDTRSIHLMAVTAKTSVSLIGNIDRLISWLEKNTSVYVPALSYTTTARRMHHGYRCLISGGDVETIVSGLKTSREQAERDPRSMSRGTRVPGVVFTFTGQGNSYVGMGKSLYGSNATFRKTITRLNHLAQIQGFAEFIGLIDGSHSEDLHASGPVVSQLALTCLQIALVDLWQSWGITPSAVIGHSLGEYAALYTAGVISAATTIYLVGIRATFLERHCMPHTHAMLAVKTSLESSNKIISATGGRCEIACANHPNAHVLSGTSDDILSISRQATESGIESFQLNIPFAFHSSQVDSILVDFEAAASKGVVYHPPKIPVISPLLSKFVPDGQENILHSSYLTRACRDMVDFKGAIDYSRAHSLINDHTIWLEIGPHPACGSMIKSTLGRHAITTASLHKDFDAYRILTSTIKTLYSTGIELEWEGYHRDFPAAHTHIQLPTYVWDCKNYWIPYRNDFCLTKGDDGPQPASGNLEQSKIPHETYKYLSPSVQKVIEESHGTTSSSVLVQSDIFHERLAPILRGHLVNGAALASSSLYADIALTIASFMLQGPGFPAASTGLAVSNVTIEAPLIALPTETSHLYRVSADADWQRQLISLSIYSVDTHGERTISHAALQVHVTPQQSWAEEWKRNTHLITGRIDTLSRGVTEGNNHKLRRGMVYKLFSSLVTYSKEFRGMESVVLDSERLEAVSTVRFQVGNNEFLINPQWIDSLGQIAGFIMNGNDTILGSQDVFINHGWERMRIAETLKDGETYYAYNRMQLVDKSLYAGDTYILHGDRIIALFEGVKFQGVPRRVLDHLLPDNKSRSPQGRNSTSKPQPSLPSVREAANSSSARAMNHDSLSLTQATPPSLRLFERVLAIISDEVGITPSELTPESEFAGFGIDSLLSLTVTARMRDEIGLDFPSSIFMDCPTVIELHNLIRGRDVGNETDGSSSDLSNHEDSQTSIPSLTAQSQSPPQPTRASVSATLRDILAQEAGIATNELSSSTNLAELGIDSLLRLDVASKLSEAFQAEISHAIFMGNESLEEVEKALNTVLGTDCLQEAQEPRGHDQFSGFSLEADGLRDRIPSISRKENKSIPAQPELTATSPPYATSVLLSGSPKTAQKVLFLFPDGSGSAFSYASLARSLSSELLVYGLNCPWRKTANEMLKLGITMNDLAAKYFAEIQRIISNSTFQLPKSSFSLGGWSAGGMIALEVARQMSTTMSNSKMSPSHLVLFDSPNPIGLQNPPQRMYDFLDSIGIFGGGNSNTKMPDWLREHFDAFINVLDNYQPTQLPNAPQTLMIYARDGVCKDPTGPQMETRSDDPREMFWLLYNRTDFSANGWASLLGRQNLTVRILDDVNHFTMMDSGPKMELLGDIVSDFLL